MKRIGYILGSFIFSLIVFWSIDRAMEASVKVIVSDDQVASNSFEEENNPRDALLKKWNKYNNDIENSVNKDD